MTADCATPRRSSVFPNSIGEPESDSSRSELAKAGLEAKDISPKARALALWVVACSEFQNRNELEAIGLLEEIVQKRRLAEELATSRHALPALERNRQGITTGTSKSTGNSTLSEREPSESGRCFGINWEAAIGGPASRNREMAKGTQPGLSHKHQASQFLTISNILVKLP